MDDAALPSPTSRRPLSYTPYQSHRRTNSQRSNASTPGPPTPPPPAPVASFSSSGASSSSTGLARPAPANNASSSSLRPSSTVIEPSPLRNSLPEPPPLRRLNAKPDKPTPAPAAAPTLKLQPAQPVVERDDDAPKATSPPPRSPARIDSPPLNGPPQRKAISTSQALRMRDHGRAAGLDSSAASTASSDNTPRTQSPVPPSPATAAHPRIAYTQPRHAFQPRGVSRSQLVEFVEAKARVAKKKKSSSSSKKNGVAKLAAQNGDEDAQRTEERIRRRVEKLVTLHYPSTSTEPATDTEPSLPSSSSSSSLLSSALFTTLAPHSRFLTTLRQSSALRAAEQALVPWQPDDEVQACPICGGAFAAGVGSKGVGRRRHHCRACGRVVCASPDIVARGAEARPDQLNGDTEGRRQALVFGGKCSGTVVLDEASLDVAAGETRLTIKDLVTPDGGAEDSFEAFLKQQRSKDQGASSGTEGFRLCRDCRQIVLRGQYMDEEANVPTYVRLYDELTALQREIERTLPAFQELVMGLQKSNGDVASTIDDTTPQPSAREAKIQLQLQRDAARARKGLLANFAKYDALAKRIRDLPFGDDVGLKRLKENVCLRAGVFLQTNMFPLQSLPKIDSTPRAPHGRSPSSSAASASTVASPHLAVLQEQRSQIAHFLDCANRERKLNDAASLRRNLEELDAEIAKLSVAGGANAGKAS